MPTTGGSATASSTASRSPSATSAAWSARPFVDITPRTINLTLGSSLAGVTLTLDGASRPADAHDRRRRWHGACPRGAGGVSVENKKYKFVRWSDDVTTATRTITTADAAGDLCRGTRARTSCRRGTDLAIDAARSRSRAAPARGDRASSPTAAIGPVQRAGDRGIVPLGRPDGRRRRHADRHRRQAAQAQGRRRQAVEGEVPAAAGAAGRDVLPRRARSPTPRPETRRTMSAPPRGRSSCPSRTSTSAAR